MKFMFFWAGIVGVAIGADVVVVEVVAPLVEVVEVVVVEVVALVEVVLALPVSVTQPEG